MPPGCTRRHHGRSSYKVSESNVARAKFTSRRQICVYKGASNFVSMTTRGLYPRKTCHFLTAHFAFVAIITVINRFAKFYSVICYQLLSSQLYPVTLVILQSVLQWYPSRKLNLFLNTGWHQRRQPPGCTSSTLICSIRRRHLSDFTLRLAVWCSRSRRSTGQVSSPTSAVLPSPAPARALIPRPHPPWSVRLFGAGIEKYWRNC